MAAKSTVVYSDEIKIDVGKYIETLVRQWAWILGCAALLGVAAIAISQLINLTKPSYQASALVASSKTVSVVNFGGAISSQSETDLASSAAAGAQYLYDRKARLQSYVALVRNGNVAEQVLAQVGPKLKPDQRSTSDLLSMVNGSLVTNTDSIRITVTYSDPEVAAEIANAWAQAYVLQINDLYGDSSVGTSVTAIQSQIKQSKAAYDQAQEALAEFETQNKSAEYLRQVTQLTTIVTDLRNSLSAVADQQVQYGMARLKQAYADKLLVQRYLGTVASMRDAVKKGGEGAAISNSLALTLLKTQIYASFEGTNTLQVQNLPESMGTSISTVNAASMTADLDALTTALNAEAAQLDALIADTSTGIQSGSNLGYLSLTASFSPSDVAIEQKIGENEQTIRDLNSKMADLTARETELTKARDLAWQSYSALETKGTEMSVAAQTTGSEVVFASSATPPKDKIVRSGINAAVAGLVGLLIGLVSAYAYEFWQNYKGRKVNVLSRRIFEFPLNFLRKRTTNSKPVEV